MTLRYLLHPQRANRLVLQKSLDENQLGLEEVFDELILRTFGLTYLNDYYNSVSQQIEANVLKYIMNLAVNDQSYFQVKGLANNAILKIERRFTKGKKSNEEITSQFYRIIQEFKEHPEKFKIESSPKIPDGSPIGSDVCSYNSN